MKKTDMESHDTGYCSLMATAFEAEKNGQYFEAIKCALAAGPHIDGMMQYAQKYQARTFNAISAVEMVLRYAPLLLDAESLLSLGLLVKENRRIERDAYADWENTMSEARTRMWSNHLLWDYLEKHPGARQDELRQVLGGDQDHWRSTAKAWEKMGLIKREKQGEAVELRLATRLEETVLAKCPLCGKVATDAKFSFLAERSCPNCGATALLVILVGGEDQKVEA